MQGIELGGFELAEFDKRRELCFWLVYGNGDVKMPAAAFTLEETQ